MKIKKLTLTNFRNVPDGEYDLNGANFLLIGDNQVGKSNFLKACQLVIGDKSAVGIESVKTGEDKAKVEAILAEYGGDGNSIPGTDYTFKAKFKKGTDLPSVEVIAPNGFKDEKKSSIGSILGQVEFDIDEFVEWSKSKEGRKKQIDKIKSFLSKEVRAELNKIEDEIIVDYNIRTTLNCEIKTYNGFIAETGMSASETIKYKVKIDISGMQNEMKAAIETNSKIKLANSDLLKFSTDIKDKLQKILLLKNEILQLESDIESLEKKQLHAKTFLSKNIELTIDNSSMDQAIAHNEICNKVEALMQKVDKRNELVEREAKLSKKIDANRQMKADIVRDANLPISGLGFDDESLLYHGKKVDESMFSFSEIAMLGVEIKMAMASGSEVLFIHNGESWGFKRLQALQAKAEERGFQLLMEQVERGTEELRLEIMPKY